MDAATIGFLAAVVLASGLIAYFADWLGRKLGKKRLSFRKLRPRHTAALITTLSGMIVSMLTILLVMAFSSDVRDWILKGNAAIRQAQERFSQLQMAERKLRLKNEELALRTKELDQMKSSYANLSTQKQSAESQVKVLQGEAKTLTSNVQGLRDEVASAKLDAGRAQAKVSLAQRNLAQLQQAKHKTDESLGKATQTLAAAMKQYNDVNRRTIDLERDLGEAETKLRTAGQALVAKQEEVGALDKQLDQLKDTLTEAQSKLRTTSAELEDEQAKLELTRIELDGVQKQLQRSTEALKSNLQNTRLKQIIVPGGEELARIQIAPGQTREQVRAALETVLRDARKASTERGAKPARAGGPVASLRNQQTTDGRVITAEDQIEGIVSAATNLREQAVIIANSFWNVFENEDVPLIVVAYKNPLIYKEGQIVAEARIDGRGDEGLVLQQLTAFFSDKLKKKALADKMIPAAGREQSLGSVTFEELFSLARDIKDTRRQVRLVAVAKQDTRAADPLRLDMRIR